MGQDFGNYGNVIDRKSDIITDKKQIILTTDTRSKYCHTVNH
jgi:hypothetical protein